MTRASCGLIDFLCFMAEEGHLLALKGELQGLVALVIGYMQLPQALSQPGPVCSS